MHTSCWDSKKQVCVLSNCVSELTCEGWRLGHRVVQEPLDEKQGEDFLSEKAEEICCCNVMV